MGHVKQIQEKKVILEEGTLSTGHDVLYIDCTAKGIQKMKTIPIFSKDKITIQPVVHPLITLSAALIALVETKIPNDDDTTKNSFVEAAPHVETFQDYLESMWTSLKNNFKMRDYW